jgi:transglutaminase-like putative cysteine protease
MAQVSAPLQWLAMALLGLGLIGVQWTLLFGGLAVGLAVLTALKLWEVRRIRERRLVALLQLLSAGMLAALQADLAASVLQGLAALFALAGLLALEIGEGLGWRVMLRRSMQLLLAALPMALLLFLLLPRLSPFTVIDIGRGAGATTGLSDTLDPGGIAELSSSQAPAARVAFPLGDPPPPPQRYWRVLVHDRFDGRAWSASLGDPDSRSPAQRAAMLLPPAPSPPPGRGSPQLWLDQPSGLPAVPWSGGGVPVGGDLRIDRLGQLHHRGSAAQRRLYTLIDTGEAPAWAGLPPTPQDLQLEPGRNPQLEALGRGWAALATPGQRLEAAEQWFRGQPFRYTLRPGTLPARAPLDSFLFERREGFCGHYASSFAALMRAAGVPARVVSGYRGGDWVVPLGGTGYLDIRQAQAHAWSEVWLAGEGWRAVDPTTWVPASMGEAMVSRGGALRWLQHQWWGLDLAWTRLWLGFDRQGQEALLERLLGGQRQWLGVLVLAALAASLAGGVALLLWLQRRAQRADPWRRELNRCLALLARRGLVPEADETLARFAARVGGRQPELAQDLDALVAVYQRQRFAAHPTNATAIRSELRQARRQLGRRLRRLPPDAIGLETR